MKSQKDFPTTSTQTNQINTAEFAKLNLVKPESVRTRYCLTGSWYGVVPLKLASGRLAWPQHQEVAS